MNDPHVERLYYNLVHGSQVAYRSPPPVTYSSAFFDLRLDEGILVAEMKTHCASAGSAIDLVRPVLRSWEVQTSLVLGYDSFRFDYDKADIVDRQPSGAMALSVTGSGSIAISGTAAEMKVEYASYPAPPNNFLATPLVELLWSRLKQYYNKREPLASMGYFCLSVIQNDANGRGNAAAKYSIKRDVLDKVGTLTSEVGDELSARKYDPGSTKRPHTAEEENWILAAVKKIIWRVAEYSADPSRHYAEISIADIK